MARGGSRQGTPGKAYANRTDLNQPVQAAGTGEYGSVAQQENSLKQMPLQNAGAQRAQQAQGGSVAPQIAPGPLDRPTERPNEPVTAGAPAGMGPGMEALGVNQVDDESIALLQVAYQQHPSEGLRQLLETLAEEV